MHWNPEPAPNHGFWAVTRYDDIWTVDRDPETFTSEKFVNLEEVGRRPGDPAVDAGDRRCRGTPRCASSIQREFTPRNLLNNYEGFLRELTRNTLDAAFDEAAANGGEIDFVEEISADFPIKVLARLLDVPQGGHRPADRVGQRVRGNTDPDFAKVRADLPESRRSTSTCRSARPPCRRSGTTVPTCERARVGGDGTDLVSILANKLPDDGVPLSEQDFNMYFTLLVIAGNETTRHAISNSMLGLIEQPDQLAAAPGATRR